MRSVQAAARKNRKGTVPCWRKACSFAAVPFLFPLNTWCGFSEEDQSVHPSPQASIFFRKRSKVSDCVLWAALTVFIAVT